MVVVVKVLVLMIQDQVLVMQLSQCVKNLGIVLVEFWMVVQKVQEVCGFLEMDFVLSVVQNLEKDLQEVKVVV